MPAKEPIEKLLSSPPAAFARLGKRIFLPVPLYQAKRTYRPVYINADLFNRLFEPKKPLSFEEMSSLIQSCFNSTIEKEKGTGMPVGTAYVDRQADPLDLSLSGNLGSGRAYYMGKYFNIKGEKTPLAISTKRRFSDGLLEMERCIWETVVANGLQGSFKNGLNAVLAILDMDETCDVIWRDEPVRRGKIIRVDLDGALDRITHVFYNKTPLKKNALIRTAKNFGIQEADKFTERIVHGTWSPGNISPNGHLIDFDTVAATKGRSPQYSSTQWHHENYFGYEYLGQEKILAALARDRHINQDKVSADLLKKALIDTRLLHIRQNLVYLMGFKDQEQIYKRYKSDIDALCDLWMPMAQKSYKKLKALSSKETGCVMLPVFDFSLFFRLYAMQKRLKLFSVAHAMKLLCTKELFYRGRHKKLNKIARQHQDAVMAVIGKDFVLSQQELNLLKIAAARFVKTYDRLHEKITQETRASMKETEARAYIINEDRFYMFPAYTLSYEFAERQKRKPAESNKIIEALITATRRIPVSRIADIRIEKKGWSFVQLDGKGYHQAGICLFKTLPNARMKVKKGKKTYVCTQQKTNKTIYLSKKIDNRFFT